MAFALEKTSWIAAPRPADAVLRVRLMVSLIAAALAAACLMASAGSLLRDPDNWWHVRVGLDILAGHALPTVDAYSHTFAGQPWIAKEWLAQVLFALAYEAGGWNGVALLTIAAAAATVGLLAWFLGAHLKPVAALGATLLLAVFVAPLFNARPFVLTLPIAVVWTAGLFEAAREKRAPSLWLLPLLALWANLHAAFTFGFAIAFFAGLDVLARTRLAQPRLLARWVAFGLLCPLFSLVHPYGVQAMLATLSVAHDNEAVALIGEWQPFNAAAHYQQEVVLLLAFFGLLVAPVRIGWAKALFFVFALHLFLVHNRFMYLPALFPLLVAAELAAQYPAASARVWAQSPRDRVEQLFADRFPAAAGCVALLVALGAGLFATGATVAPGEDTSAEGALAFAQAHNLSGNVLNSYNFGGTLIFHGIKTFIDGRTDQLFLDGFMQRDFDSASSAGKPILVEELEKHAIRWALLKKDDGRVPFFDELPGWRRLYGDAEAVIYAKE